MESWLPRESIRIKGAELFSPMTWFPGSGEGAESSTNGHDFMNHACVMRPPQKSKGMDSESFWVGESELVLVLLDWTPNIIGTEALCLGPHLIWL